MAFEMDMNFYVFQMPPYHPVCETDQIPSLPSLRRGVLLAGFGEGHHVSCKRGVLPRVRGHTVRLFGRCRHGHPPLRGSHMRAKDAARGTSRTRGSDTPTRRGATVTGTGLVPWKIAWRAAARRPETPATHTCCHTLINMIPARDVRHASGS